MDLQQERPQNLTCAFFRFFCFCFCFQKGHIWLFNDLQLWWILKAVHIGKFRKNTTRTRHFSEDLQKSTRGYVWVSWYGFNHQTTIHGHPGYEVPCSQSLVSCFTMHYAFYVLSLHCSACAVSVNTPLLTPRIWLWSARNKLAYVLYADCNNPLGCISSAMDLRWLCWPERKNNGLSRHWQSWFDWGTDCRPVQHSILESLARREQLLCLCHWLEGLGYSWWCRLLWRHVR